jgi:lysophospholipase L1-like esterase
MGQKTLPDKRPASPVLDKPVQNYCGIFCSAYNQLMKSFALLSLMGWLCAMSLRPAFGAEPAHNFGQWEKEIAAFEAGDRTNPPPTNAVLFIGSSTIRFWTTLVADFPGQPVINRGFGGSEIADSTHFADRIVFPYAPKAIFFRAGGNDIDAGESPEAVFADFKDFVGTVHAKLPDTDIYFISWSATITRWKNRDKEKILNDSVKQLAAQTPHLKYIETGDLVLGADGKPRPELFRADGIHLNAAGYKLLIERVRPYLPK